MRKRITFTIDEEFVRHIEKTRGDRSASERVNDLLRRGMRQELDEELARQAREFFRKPDLDERSERRAFLKLTKRSWARDKW